VRADRVDRILCLSSWHRAHLAERYPFAKGKLTRIRNGITPSYFTTEPAPEREKRVLYTSSPDRGLDILLELWPSVRKRVPDAELVHTHAPVYDRIADRIPSVRAHRERIRKLSAQPGVCGLAGLAQPNLTELLRSSLVWAHPAFITGCGARMMETSCIGAMEAQAAGCCVVAAGWGALPETVKVGKLIDGDPMGRAFRETFADAIVTGLTNEDVQTKAQTGGPAVALGWGWDGVAEMVAALIEPALAAR
jgi:glycosyltransferase involved in cell wall biosynthesis